MKAARERERREQFTRTAEAAYRQVCNGLDRNADAVAGFGVAGLSAVALAFLMRKPRADSQGWR
ncbi:MAG: hypothetical protein U0835_05360 [Isosphaeraceae bacterium]